MNDNLKDLHKMGYSSAKMIRQFVCSVPARAAAMMVKDLDLKLQMSELDRGEYFDFSWDGRTILGIEPYCYLMLENGEHGCAVSIFSPDSEEHFAESFAEAITTGKRKRVVVLTMEQVIEKCPELAAVIDALNPVMYKLIYDRTSDED